MTIRSRLLALIFGLAVAVLAAEAALRLASLAVGPRAMREILHGRSVILTLGDSHTYGVFYAEEQSYPGQLQALLDQERPGRYQVVNLGLPGMNSSEVRSRLAGWIATHEPSAVVLGVGVNNIWNPTDRDTVSARRGGTWRLVKLWRLLRSNLAGARSSLARPMLDRRMADDAQAVEHRDAESGALLIRHQGPIEHRIDRRLGLETLRRDVRSIDGEARQHGVRLILLAYSAAVEQGVTAFEWLDLVNQELERLAQALDLEWLDPRPGVRLAMAQGQPREALFHTAKSDHPNPTTYRRIAELVKDRLLAGEAGAEGRVSEGAR